MAAHVILWLIAAVLAGVAVFVVPARFNLVAAALCLGMFGFFFQAVGA